MSIFTILLCIQMIIFKNLKNKNSFLWALGLSLMFFDIQYLIMKDSPLTHDGVCFSATNLTMTNLVFSVFLSISLGIFLVNFVLLMKREVKAKKVMLGSLSGLGFILGLFSLFCPVCLLPIFALGGLSFLGTFLSHHSDIIKIVSLVLIIFSLYFLEKRWVSCPVSLKRKSS